MEISKSNANGALVISEEAISSIATNAAKDVDGIAGFFNKPADIVTTIKKGSLKLTSPVRIVQDGDDLNISIYAVVAAGAKIQPVAEKVQRVVKDAVQNMTGKFVSKVNVIIASVEKEESADSAVPKETEE